jgi:hypothetical protein
MLKGFQETFYEQMLNILENILYELTNKKDWNSLFLNHE